MKNIFKNKKILITGGSGMIASQLINLLKDKAGSLTVTDLYEPKTKSDCFNFIQADLREFSECRKITKNVDFVFNLVGIKASPKACLEQPANIIGPMLQFNTNMLEAAMESNVEWFLYTSSVGVYHPAPLLKEDDVWATMPSKNDWYGGWAKRIGEMQIMAHSKQKGHSKCSIVRPANVYGPHDNFDLNSAMVIPSLIRKADEDEKLFVWGDGSQIRDFIHAHDVARGMIFAVENKITEPINLGSGEGVKIETIANIIADYFKKDLIWQKDKPAGDPVRLFDTSKAKSYGYQPEINIEKGLANTIEWYLNNKSIIKKKYGILSL